MKPPTCKDIQNKFSDYLTSSLDEHSMLDVQTHFKGCNNCKLELEELTSIWTKLEILPEVQPGPKLRQNFYSMLETEIKKKNRIPFWKKIFNNFDLKPVPRFAHSLLSVAVLIAVGFLAGFYAFSGQKNQYLNKITDLQDSQSKSQQKLVMAYLDQSSPIQRLKGVSESTEIKNPDNNLLNALLNTLNHDPNINVRLSAVEALYLYTENPLVKEGLFESMAKQSSPMVQIALIDLLTEIRETRAIQALKILLLKEKINPKVKKRAETIIQQTI